jgi:predicted DNA-binding transcriptional regulator AlpA
MKRKHVIVEKGPKDLIAFAEVSQLCGLGEGEILERRKNGTFPKPVDVSASLGSRKRAVRWVRAEVESWVETRILERDRLAALERERARRDREILDIDSKHPVESIA